jgi:hypothetical protein
MFGKEYCPKRTERRTLFLRVLSRSTKYPHIIVSTTNVEFEDMWRNRTYLFKYAIKRARH